MSKVVSRLVQEHLERVRTAVLTRHTAATIGKWVTTHTFYAGAKYSFEDHEFQEYIISDPSRENNVQKCSQVGVSEVSARMALALVNVLNPYTVIYTLPTATFARVFTKTRLNPVIEGSATMRANVHKTNHNNEVIQFGDSFIYIRGAASSNAPISIPADHLIHDEVDFSDQETLEQYFSRLTHSKWRRISRLSTPTLPNFGINKHFMNSRRHYMFCKCSHCNHQFIPDYYQHVKIPGYTGELRDITKYLLTKIDWENAAIHCPNCGKIPDLSVKFREMVCENPGDKLVAAGFQVSPFDAPQIITASRLVEASTKYDRIQDFVNFNLGLPMEDKEATLTQEDFKEAFIRVIPSMSCQYVMGVDIGAMYHFKIGAVDPYGNVLCVHSEMVGMGRARQRYRELREQFRVICTVMDSLPHGETVMALQNEDPAMYASVYTKTKSVMAYEVVEREAVETEGKSFLRQVNVNRSKAFDAYMEALRSGQLKWLDGPLKDLIIEQHMSMKRVKVYEEESKEMAYSWQKSDGNDHFHHAGLYMWVASKIRSLGRSLIVLPLFSVRKISTKHRPKDRL